MGNRSLRSPLCLLVTFVALVFLVVPLLVVVLFSFQSTSSLSLPFHGFSLQWYTAVFEEEEFKASVEYTLLIGLVVVAVIAIGGTLTAYGMTKLTGRTQGAVGLLFYLPLALPQLFLGLALRVYFARLHIDRSLFTITMGQVIVTLPPFLLILRSGLDRLDPRLAEAAAALGANPVQVFTKVVLPQIRPILYAAIALVFALSIDEFAVTFWTAGSESTVPLLIYSKVRAAVTPLINAISSLLMLTTILVFAIVFVSIVRAERRRRLTPDDLEGLGG